MNLSRLESVMEEKRTKLRSHESFRLRDERYTMRPLKRMLGHRLRQILVGALMCTVLMVTWAGAPQSTGRVKQSNRDLRPIIRKHDLHTLEQRLKSGESPNEPKDHPPIVLAAVLGDYDSVRILLHFHANQNALDRLTGSALKGAAFSGNAKLVELLLKAGANPNGVDDNLETPLMAADNAACAQILIRNRCNIEAYNVDGMRALHAFCEKGLVDGVRLLLKSHAKVNARDKYGNTPLMYVCWLERGSSISELARIEMARLLIRGGADLTITNKVGATPAKAASESGFSDLAKLMSHELK